MSNRKYKIVRIKYIFSIFFEFYCIVWGINLVFMNEEYVFEEIDFLFEFCVFVGFYYIEGILNIVRFVLW